MRLPPQDVAPERLFRLLAGRDRARWPIEVPALGVSGLFVLALTGPELAELVDDSLELDSPLERQQRDAVIARVVWCDGAPAWPTPDAFDAPEEVAEEIWRGVVDALSRCSPVYGRCDSVRWEARLRAGARHVSNWQLTRGILDSATHIALTDQWVGQPDRFYGRPMCDLTDGQLLAFDAAWSTR